MSSRKRRREATIEAPTLEEIGYLTRRQKLDRSGPMANWTTEEVVDALRKHGITDEDILQRFSDHEIEGKHLAQLDKQDLTDMGISAVGTQKNILATVKAVISHNMQRGEGKVFNDPIHGHIELHPLMVRFVDTPQFQRLRYIKQLGGGYYVFPGASHNRFEHSIGVGYLAGEMVETLQRKQPELHITEEDVLCVKLAGLCHDLGHGPFSHLFDSRFIPRVLPDTKWKHEEASVMMFHHLIDENGLREEMKKYGLEETDLTFIKELIAGPINSDVSSSQNDPDWPYMGRPVTKSFLYEIVANKRTGVDVDKWDYFARDCHHLGIPNSFDLRRYMKFARVIEVEGKLQICVRDKEVTNLYEMFHTRHTLHRRAYQHKTSNIIEVMITEALVAANDHLMIPGQDDKLVKMSEAIIDPVAYTRLTDQILQQIQLSPDPHLKEARDILGIVERRRLYKYVGQAQPKDSKPLTKKDAPRIRSEMIGCLTADSLNGLPVLEEEDFIILIATFDYGMGSQNPIDRVRFYTKDNPQKADQVPKDKVSQMLPQVFKEQQIRVFCKKVDKDSLKAAWKYFRKWCEKHITPEDGAVPEDYLNVNINADDRTPYSSPFPTPVKSDSSTPSADLPHQQPANENSGAKKRLEL